MEVSSLIANCKHNDRRAQHELFYRYAKQIMYVAYRYMGDKQLAEDSVQETFIKVFKYIHTLEADNETSLLAWMKKIAVRECLQVLKKRRRLHLTDDVVTASSTDNDAPSKLNQDELLELINQLPAGYRTVLQMYAIDGFSHEEIAQELGISAVTSRSQLSRARGMLKAQWNHKKQYHARL